MSDEALKIRVAALKADIFDVEVKLADVNNVIDELKQRFDGKHGIQLIDWIYRLLEHEPILEMSEKKRLTCKSRTCDFITLHHIAMPSHAT